MSGVSSSGVVEYPGIIPYGTLSNVPYGVNGVLNTLDGHVIYVNGNSATELTTPGLGTARTICDWQPTLGALSVVNGTFALDNNVLIEGKPTIKATLSAVSPFTGTYTLNNPVSLASFRSISLQVKVTTNTVADNGMTTTSLFVALTLVSGKIINLKCVTIDLCPGVFNLYAWHATEATNGNFFTYAGGAASSDITGGTTLLTDFVASIAITTTTGVTSGSYPLWFGPVIVDAANGSDVGVVSWIFDKNTGSQATLGTILAQTNTKACFALIPTSVGVSTNLTTTQLASLYADGHDMIHHTYVNNKTNGYTNATDWPTAALITNDIMNTWAYLKAAGWTRGIGYGVSGFTSPFTSTTSTVRAQLVRDAYAASGMKAIRTGQADVGRQMLMGNSKTAKEIKVIYCQHITSSTTTLPAIQALVDTCALNKSHLIFMCHGVDGIPSNESLPSSVLIAALTYIQSKSGVINMKFTDALIRDYL
jgi:hypothetical protein